MNELGVRCIDVRDLAFVFYGGIKLLKRTKKLVRINQLHDFSLLIRDWRLIDENHFDGIVARQHNKGGAGQSFLGGADSIAIGKEGHADR